MIKQPQHSPQFLRQRKMLLVMPLLVLPFICIVFVALGGGKGEPKAGAVSNNAKGFNMNLPGAHFAKKETILNKLGFYEKADEDSAKLMDRIRQDPYHTKPAASAFLQRSALEQPFKGIAGNGTGHLSTSLSAAPAEDSNANKLLKQLDQLKQVLHRPTLPAALPASNLTGSDLAMLPSHNPDMNRLEKLMQSLNTADTSGGDPQMEKLNGMLDKIIKIQHPVQNQPVEKDIAAVPKTTVLPVMSPQETVAVTNLEAEHPSEVDSSYQEAGGFYSIDEPDQTDLAVQNTIAAVIPEDQTLVAGATITLRLTQEAVVTGMTIPRDNLLYGLISISGDRMLVTVTSIRYNQGIYPVSLQVYDMDGLPGIHIPGAITRDVAKESTDQGISSLGLTSLDSSIGGQAATAGIEAAKTLISRKIRLVRVSVKAGYQVLLKNTKVKTH
jgi:hypothetical protein